MNKLFYLFIFLYKLTSLQIDGNTLSSKSTPNCLYICGKKFLSGRESTRKEMLTICKSISRNHIKRVETLINLYLVPLLPVGEEIFFGLVRMSYIIG